MGGPELGQIMKVLFKEGIPIFRPVSVSTRMRGLASRARQKAEKHRRNKKNKIQSEIKNMTRNYGLGGGAP
jgi:hypothetical protein